MRGSSGSRAGGRVTMGRAPPDGPVPAPPAVAEGVGTYAFMQTQRGSDDPVGYDPCRVIEVEINPDGAPAQHDALVDTGLARVSAATGLRFERVGTTGRRPSFDTVSPRRSPVLIAWATLDEVPELAGDIAGLAGSVSWGQPGQMRYVTGTVALDRDYFDSLGPADLPMAQAVVDHELGHLVGLGHVDDPNELMHEDSLQRWTYGPGDREGMARLGNLDC
ncbi:hypothetical protein IEQ44_11375 [Nocardioides sp. Y6]|uniref:Matrixin family metalloprotease n=2 Tax=Nocardioides malaquae TaxID=2773426 RepID=A0ABR9RUJ6_9ACTN|nr:hypothetical protein [Nocardioides malaquae]